MLSVKETRNGPVQRIQFAEQTGAGWLILIE